MNWEQERFVQFVGFGEDMLDISRRFQEENQRHGVGADEDASAARLS
jgi:hypothetical protein